MRLEQFAETEHALIEIANSFGIERVHRQMCNARNALFGRRQSEIALAQSHRMGLGVVDAHFAVLQVGGFLHHDAARVSFKITFHDRVDVVDRDADVMQAVLHAEFVQVLAHFEDRDVVAAIRQRDVAGGRAAQLVHAEVRLIEPRQRRRIIRHEGEITDARHVVSLPECFQGRF